MPAARTTRRKSSNSSLSEAAAKGSSSSPAKLKSAVAAATPDSAAATTAAANKVKGSSKKGKIAVIPAVETEAVNAPASDASKSSRKQSKGKKDKSAVKSDSITSNSSSSKGKSKSDASAPTSASSATSSTLPWQSLADPTVYSAEPPLFTPDGAYYFLPTSQSIRIVSRHTGVSVSTLTQPVVSGSSQASDATGSPPYRHRITALALNPANPLQLLSASTDGSICVWNYLDARLVRVFLIPQSHASSSGSNGASSSTATADVEGMAITHLVASEHLPEWAFICARRPKSSSGRGSSSYSTILLAVSLSVPSAGSAQAEPVSQLPQPGSAGNEGTTTAAERVPVYIPRTQSRLGKIKLIPSAVRLSPRAEHLVVVGGEKIHVASLRRTRSEAGVSGESSAEVETVSCPDGLARFTTSDDLTTLAIHPTENSIAAGDVKGKIRIFHGLLEEDFLERRRSADVGEDDDDVEMGQADSSQSGKPKFKSSKKSGGKKQGSSAFFFGAPSTTLHWHAHAVSTLAYVPLAATGARLLSGGEEATLVLWHISAGGGGAGRVQKEFVPRLGAAIASVCLAGPADAPVGASSTTAAIAAVEEEIVCALRDGSLVFLNPANLRVLRTFARFKVDAGRSLLPAWRQRTLPAPLAIQPIRASTDGSEAYNVVLTSGDPSTIQFYDPSADALISELEVVSSNRISRPDDMPLEPARVEHVAFSPLLPVSPAVLRSDKRETVPRVAEWMATLDARRPVGASRDAAPRFTSEISLKFWAWDAEEGRYALCTSIDRPHGDEGVISDLSFGWLGNDLASSSAGPGGKTSNRFENLVCVSTGSDGKIKTWRPVALARTESLGAAASKKAAKRERERQERFKHTADPTAFHWVARSIFTFRSTMPHALAWAPDSLPSSAFGSTPIWKPASTSGLFAVAQGAFVTVWELGHRTNSLCVALCAPELASRAPAPSVDASSSSTPLIEGAHLCAFVGRGGRFVVGASSHVVVCWDLLNGKVVWSKSYAEVVKSDEDASGGDKKDEKRRKSRTRNAGLRIERIITVPSGGSDSAEDVFGILLSDAHTASSRLELFDLANLVRKPERSKPHSTLTLPFFIRSLTTVPGLRSEAPSKAVTATKSELSTRKLENATKAIAGFALSSTLEPVVLGQPALLALGSSAHTGEGDANDANLLPRGAAEDAVRARRVRTILDDLLGGGQAFLPDSLPSSGGGKDASKLVHSNKTKAGAGQVDEVFRLFEAPAHLLPPMPALFDAFSAAILPRRAGAPAVAADKVAGEAGRRGDSESDEE